MVGKVGRCGGRGVILDEAGEFRLYSQKQGVKIALSTDRFSVTLRQPRAAEAWLPVAKVRCNCADDRNGELTAREIHDCNPTAGSLQALHAGIKVNVGI